MSSNPAAMMGATTSRSAITTSPPVPSCTTRSNASRNGVPGAVRSRILLYSSRVISTAEAQGLACLGHRLHPHQF